MDASKNCYVLVRLEWLKSQCPSVIRLLRIWNHVFRSFSPSLRFKIFSTGIFSLTDIDVETNITFSPKCDNCEQYFLTYCQSDKIVTLLGRAIKNELQQLILTKEEKSRVIKVNIGLDIEKMKKTKNESIEWTQELDSSKQKSLLCVMFIGKVEGQVCQNVMVE